MPVEASAILELASKCIRLQQDSELANALNKAEDVSSISSEIKKLEETNLSIWHEVEGEADRLKLEIKLIIKYTNLEEKSLEQYKARKKTVDFGKVDSLRREAAYSLVLRFSKIRQQIDSIRRENEQRSALEVKRLGKREQLFKPLLGFSYNNYMASFNRRGNAILQDVFSNHPDIIELKQAIQSNESLIKLKEDIFNLIKNKKELKKNVEKDKYSNNPLRRFGEFLDSLFDDYGRSLSDSLNKVKKNINLELYPTFGKQIDTLENYIQNLKEAGVYPNQSKQNTFKSDRSEKLSIAEKLKNDLIAFEGKNVADRKIDPHITVIAIEDLIKKNTDATGSRYLHGKGKLDKILKDLKNEIDFSINKNYTEKLKAEHLKGLEKKALKEAMVSGSEHFFRGEIVELTDLINWNDRHVRSCNDDPSSDPKEDTKIAKKIRTLLLYSEELSNTKREILKSRITADIKKIELRGQKNELVGLLKKIEAKIENPKKLRP